MNGQILDKRRGIRMERREVRGIESTRERDREKHREKDGEDQKKSHCYWVSMLKANEKSKLKREEGHNRKWRKDQKGERD